MSAEAEIRASVENLTGLVRDLDSKENMKALRGALAEESRRVKKAAAEKVKSSGWNNAASLAKNIRAGACRDLQGYYVAVRSYGKESMHETRRSEKDKQRNPKEKRLKPVAYWLDVGTDNKGERHKRSTGARTGSTKGQHFIEKTGKEQTPGSGTRLVEAFEKHVQKILRKRFMK